MRMETFIRKQYNMKVHFVESVQENDEGLIAWVERFANRKPRCGCCGCPAPVRRHGKG